MDKKTGYRNRGARWTVRELTFVEEHYRTLPLSDIARHLERTPAAIQLMAHKLGCRGPVPVRWTSEEDDIIREHYAEGAGFEFIQTLLPGRSASSIFSRADKLGVTSGRYWRDEELQILKEHYPVIGVNVVEQLPGRSPESVRIIAARLGLRKTKDSTAGFRPWSEDEWRCWLKTCT